MSTLHPTKIQWATHSVNPIYAVNQETGRRGWACTKVAPGCQHCYAEALNRDRFGTALPYDVRSESLVDWRLDEGALQSVLSRRKPATIFWCDMTDLFHERVPDGWIDQCFAVMALTPHLRHIVLTKRPEAMRGYLDGPDVVGDVEAEADELAGSRGWCHSGDWCWPLPNVALGVSVSNQDDADSLIPHLLSTPAALRFVSYEPATGPVDWTATWDRPVLSQASGDACWLDDADNPIDAIIIGGESGTGARPFDVAWARSTIEQCEAAGVVAMVKQLGANVTGLPLATVRRVGTNHRGDPAEWPEDLRPYAASVERWPWGGAS